MSWMKQRQGSGAPPPGPERQPYTAPQAQQFGNQQNMYSNYQSTAGNPQQQYWQMPRPAQQQQFNQQYGQTYQQDYSTNANQFYQPQNPPYNQNYNQYNSQQGYNNPQQNFYQNQPIQQNFTQKTNTDAWEDNWDWGWDEASKLQSQKSQSMVQAQHVPQQQQQQQLPQPQLQHPIQQHFQQTSQLQQQQPVFNNANVIEESFGGSDSWNWPTEEKKEANEVTTAQAAQELQHEEPAKVPVKNPHVDNSVDHEPHSVNNVIDINQHGEEVKSLNDREAVKERLPNLALGKRCHLDNLTPQWSIESQMSQESSDGPLTQSEGTYRSENQSRNSSKSSPGLNTDNSNFNYSQPGLDEYHQNSEWSKSEDLTLANSIQSSSRRQSYDELTNSMQEMRLNNHENSIKHLQEQENINDKTFAIQPPPVASPANFPPPEISTNLQSQSNLHPQSAAPVSLPPPPSSAIPRPPSSSGSIPRPPSSNSLPRPPSSSASLPPSSSANLPPPPSSTVTMQPASATLPPPPSSSATLPPPNFPSQSSGNPFKHAGPFSHKTTTKTNASHIQFPPPLSNTNLSSPSVVNKASHRIPVGFEANLETTPDNSERPDQPQMSAFRPMPVTHQVPDNLEVAPQNDRNEYLQTAHLSGGDYGENTDFSCNVPPPGLRRMVVGQQESEYSQNLNISGDEPPPGLSRMVPGQQTEASNVYNQSSGNYMDRHIDGQPTDNSNSGRYRQADGQQTPDNYTQPSSSVGNERRPIGLDRMVPGEPSNDEYSQYSSTNYGGNEQRVVTGVDHDFGLTIDAGPSDIREQNVDGSDYSEQAPRNPPRNLIGAREANDVTPEFVGPPEENQREVTMEGENLQDLSAIISSAEMTFSREQMLDGADTSITDTGIDRKTDISDSMEHPATSSRRQSLNRVNTSGEDSERDRTFKSTPRKDRDRHKSSRDRDRDREREKDGRYAIDDRKYDREDRRAGRDDRRTDKDRKDRDRDRARDRGDRDESPDTRRYRRSTRGRRYETEDTDYYSDKERDRRRHREGSYTSRPPRPDDKDRRGDERDRSRRYNTIERDRRYDDEWDGSRSRRSDRHRDRDRDRYGRYRDIDPTRKYGNIRRERDDERRRGDQFSSPSRPESREATVTDDDITESRRRNRRQRTADPYYDAGYGERFADPYAVQRQQYEYYERLRLADPAAYMALYKQLMAGQHAHPHYQASAPLLYREGYPGVYSGEERGSVHSGRSSTTGLKGHDTYYGYGHEAAGSLRDAPSLRTDLSDRDLNPDASLSLQLEDSTVRSERMTPYRFSTAHVKASISSRHMVVVRPSYPADGLPATVLLVSLAGALAADPLAAELAAYPGPLVKGVTHKKSVIDYCLIRCRDVCGRDPVGHVLVWQLLALLLKQNGVVVGSDIAELLMKNTREYEYKPTATKPQVNAHNESRRQSSVSGELRDDGARSSSPDQPSLSTSDTTHQESPSSPGQSAVDEKAALDKLREYLIYGNRAEALECAMSHGLWGHALQLGAHAPRRTRASVAARFLAAIPRTDPLHTLYAALGGTAPPAATCVSEEKWGDWRPHAAILLANASARPDADRRTLTQLGDSLSSRGLIYSAQFCYVSAGVPFARHPLAPLPPAPAAAPAAPAAPAAAPRLSLLLADPRPTTLAQLATNKAIFATEIYEYALSLSQDYVITELQVYKLLMATRLVDVGQYERALGYSEQAARALTAAPHLYPRQLPARLASLADRLKYHEPALPEGPAPEEGAASADSADSAEPSPRHHQHWLDHVKNIAHMMEAEHSAQATPQHHPYDYTDNAQYSWGEQAQQYQQPVPTYAEPTEETPDYAAQYYGQQAQQAPQQVSQQVGQPEPEPYPPYGDDWHRTEEHHAQSYAEPYWQGDNSYGYGEAGGAEGAAGVAPTITMPGASANAANYSHYDDDRPPSAEQADADPDTPKQKKSDRKKDEQSRDGNKRGWFGGIFTKLSLRPPNQMILPDDKNPSIVWDEQKKRWRNLDGDADDTDQPPPPPPKMADIVNQLRSNSPPLQPPAQAASPPAAPVSNIFKMQKGRHIKKSYVDVFNPSGAAGRPPPPAAELLPPAPPAHPPPPHTYFVPAPAPQAVHVSIPPSPVPTPSSLTPTLDEGIYDPTQMSNEDDQYRSGI